MANNRLYLVNKETKEYMCIAKTFADGWILGNVDVLEQFLGNLYEFGDKTNLIIGTENDDEFYKEYIEKGNNLNTTNKWDVY